MSECRDGMRHYEVISEEICFRGWGGYEPPEYGRCWGFYLARNKREARKLAVKDPEFKEWVEEMRGSHMPPFKGLEVKPFVCEHGSCVGCWPDGDPTCSECAAEQESWALELTSIEVGRVADDA